MLLVFGAQAAVVGAALGGVGAKRPRHACRLAVLVAVVVGHVRTDEILDETVLRAALAEIDAAVAHDDLGINQAPAFRTQAVRGSEEDVIAQLHQ